MYHGARSGAQRAPELAESPVLLMFILLEASWKLLEVSWILEGLLGALGSLLRCLGNLLRPSWSPLDGFSWFPHVNDRFRIMIHHVDDIQHVNYHVDHAPTM